MSSWRIGSVAEGSEVILILKYQPLLQSPNLPIGCNLRKSAAPILNRLRFSLSTRDSNNALNLFHLLFTMNGCS
jgi:hypothetical protein